MSEFLTKSRARNVFYGGSIFFVAVFGVLVIVLIFRPSGLLGKPEIEKV